MAETIKLTCPHCGKQLDISRELTEFSCLYCGQRVKRDDPTRPSAERDAALQTLRAELADTVTRYPEHYKKITKKEFEPTFAAYEAENTPLLAQLDVAIQGDAATCKALCADFLAELERRLQSQKRWKSGHSRSQLLFETKLVLAIFLCPTVKKLKLGCAEMFCNELHAQWMEKFPKEQWYPGDYDVLIAGFKRRKWCFITTATCRSEGKPDDCAELTAFRRFRDDWLANRDGGREMIEMYYDIAPSIVACIDYCDAPAERYAELRRTWLAPCYRAIRENRNEDCRALYTEMVKTLTARYRLG